jgi:TP901 family phage tail tape measure protein
MALTVGSIVARMQLDLTGFREGLQRANSLLEQYGGTAMRSAMMLGGMSAAIGGLAGEAVKQAGEMESSLTQFNMVAKLTPEALAKVTEEIHAFAREAGVADEVLLGLLTRVHEHGFAGAEAMGVLESATRAAVARKADVAAFGESLVSVMRAYNLGASEAAKVTDSLYQASVIGAGSLNEVGGAMQGLAPLASALHIGYNEVLAALATTHTVGLPAEQVYLGLSTAMMKLTNPTKELKRALQDAGYESGQALIQAQGFAGAIKFLTDTAGDDEAMMMQMGGGVRSFRILAALASNDSALFAQKLQEMAGAAGAAGKGFEESARTWEVRWASFKVQLAQTFEAFGEKVLPVLKTFAVVLAALLLPLQMMPGPLRVIVVTAGLLFAGLASLTAGFVMWRMGMAGAGMASYGLMGAMAQMVVGLGTTVRTWLASVAAFVTGARAVAASAVVLTDEMALAGAGVGAAGAAAGAGVAAVGGPVGWIIAAVIIIPALIAGLVSWRDAQAAANAEAAKSAQLTAEQVTEVRGLIDHLRELNQQEADAQAKGLKPGADLLKDQLDTRNKIAALFPQIIAGWDAEGNAILAVADATKALTEAQKANLTVMRASAVVALDAAKVAAKAAADKLKADENAFNQIQARYKAAPGGKGEQRSWLDIPGPLGAMLGAYEPADFPALKGAADAVIVQAKAVADANAAVRSTTAQLKVIDDAMGGAAKRDAEAIATATAARQTLQQKRLAEIDAEEAALRKAGVFAATAAQFAEAQRVAAKKSANPKMLALETDLLEAEGKVTEARLLRIAVERDAEIAKLVEIQEAEKAGASKSDEAKAAQQAVGQRAVLAGMRTWWKERRDLTLESERDLADAIMGMAEHTLEQEAYVRQVRLREIKAEGVKIHDEWIARGAKQADAVAAANIKVAALTQTMDKELADARRRLFETTADFIVGTWGNLTTQLGEIETMALTQQAERRGRARRAEAGVALERARPTLTPEAYAARAETTEAHLRAMDERDLQIASAAVARDKISIMERQLALQHQINAGLQGQAALEGQAKEFKLAQDIHAAQLSMVADLEDADRKLAEEKIGWLREELAERKRMHDYELSAISLVANYQRDLATVRGATDETTMARIAGNELQMLRARRAGEVLTAEERMQSLQRERELILEMSRAGVLAGPQSQVLLRETYGAMNVAQRELKAADRAAFEEKRRQHAEYMAQIRNEQNSLLGMLDTIGRGLIGRVDEIFSRIRYQVGLMGGIRLQSELAAAGGAAPALAAGPRITNIYLGNRQLAVSSDAQKLADQLADLLIREENYPRD